MSFWAHVHSHYPKVHVRFGRHVDQERTDITVTLSMEETRALHAELSRFLVEMDTDTSSVGPTSPA